MKRLAFGLMLFNGCAGFGQAPREWNYKLELFGMTGQNRFYNGDDLWASRAGFGGGLGVRPFAGALHGLGFEFQGGSLLRTDKTFGTAPTTVLTSTASRYGAGLATYHFLGRTRVQPYVSGGLAVVSANRSFVCDQGCVYDADPVTGALTPVPVRSEVHATKVGLAFAAGMKIAVHRRISIRPEILFLDTTPGSGHNWGWVRFQIGAGLHF